MQQANIENFSGAISLDRGFKSRLGPDGLHLFNRCTGANVLFDEVVIPKDFWSKAPRQVSIALTNACDLSCVHCYAPKQKAKLDFSSLTEWLRILDLNGCIGVGFGGGEPTLYPKFSEICKYVARDTHLAVTITTHGHRLNESYLKELSGNLHFVRISMDGIGSTYEFIRGRSFDDLLKKIVLVRAIAPFGINYVVNYRTISELDNAIKIAEDYGATEFLLLPEVAVGRGADINSDTLNHLNQWIQTYKGKVRLSISENHADGLPICNPFKSDLGLRAYAHIDAQGVLKRTSFDRNGVLIGKKGIMESLQILENTAEETKQ